MRKIRFTILFVSVFLLFSQVVLFGQKRDDFTHRFSKVLELYHNDMFSAASTEIVSIKKELRDLTALETSRLESYYVFCNIKMGSPNMDALVLALEERFGPAPELSRAKLLQAHYYFGKGDYSKVVDILEEVEYRFLSSVEKKDFLFEQSFSQLRVGKLKLAEEGFEQLLRSKKNKYYLPATYYSGYIAYLNGNFKGAVSAFENSLDHEFYGPFSKLYMLESYLMLKDYDYVVENGNAVSEAVPEDMKPKVARIVSQAYFALEQPQKAKKWFDQYSSSGKELSRKDNYYLGIISYSLEGYIQSIDSFLKVLTVEDSLSQSAYFHIANSYLNLKNKRKSLENYKSASQMDFDADIKEEASFNYGKLSFDLNRDIVPFQHYLESYPDSRRSDEIYSYIATAYLLSKEYKSAISALERIKHLTPEMEHNFQKALFFRGMQLFQMGSYGDAISEFNNSLKHSQCNLDLANLTRFYLAESYYWTDAIAESVKLNKTLYNTVRFRNSKEYPLIYFNLGYSYFRQGEYLQAIEWFNHFLEQHYTNMDLILECETRMADSYFMLKDYRKSATLYEKVSIVNYKSDLIVYAAYQAAVSHGLLSDNAKKIAILEMVYGSYSESPLYPKAVYELGRTYVLVNESEKATNCFDYLLEEVNNPIYNSKALLELGMLSLNASNYEEALGYLTTIVEKMPMSQEVDDALAVIESIYVLRNRPDDYLAYLDRVGRNESKSEQEKELVYFNAAEQVFLSGDYLQANKSLSSFIEKYPDGEKTSLAHFYLAQTYSELGKKELAIQEYLVVIETGEGSFVELSLLNYSQLCFSLEKYAEAANGYQSLYDIAQFDNNRYLAAKGIMLANYKDGKYQTAIGGAETFKKNYPDKESDVTEAEYVMAKSYIALGQRDVALPILESLSVEKLLPYGAESSYILIQNVFDEGRFEEVENMVYEFSDSGTEQLYWLAKSFIVLGDSFVERGELEQAQATFESVKDGYNPTGDGDDVLEQINVRLEKINKIISEGVYNE